MIEDLALLALINDRQKFKKEGLLNIFTDFHFDKGCSENVLQNDAIYEKLISFIKNGNSKSDYTKEAIQHNLEAYKWELSKLQNEKIEIIPYYSEIFPKSLLNIKNPPLILYHKGSLFDFSNCIAIVGTRNLSYYGHIMAREIGAYFAEKGFVVVSGFARGVDTEAHMGALSATGKTIAVLPSGVLDIYPKENTKLASEIVKKGALISEISSLERINKTRFIDRNRITSGISKCVVIIETSEVGGTLQQVIIAREQNKRIFVMEPLEKDVDSLKGFKKILSLGGEAFGSPDEILKSLQQENTISVKTSHQSLSLFL